MYARDVDNKTLTFVVSGMLWNRSLVMLDQETKSLWSHILGEAKQGSLKGKQLEQIPSVMTDWATWSKRHPDGSVVLLSRTSRDYTRDFYRRPADFVLGIVHGGKARAWSFDRLTEEPALNDKLGDDPVLIAFDKESATARMYDRRLDRRVLTFHIKDGKLVDKETGTTWEPTTGRALGGQLEGSHLKSLPAIVSFQKAWKTFHPDSK